MVFLNMGHLLVLLLLLWSSGLQATGNNNLTEHVRLVGGDSRCAGELEVKHKEDWITVGQYDWTLKAAAVVCRDLDCGSAVSVGLRKESSSRSVRRISSDCVHSGSALRECATSVFSDQIVTLTCSDSVRLVEGTSLCSGRLEVKQNQSWSSVCETDFDQQDAQVVCRELGCGAPSVLQGALYGEVEAPMWTKEFQCGGNESSLLDCRISDSDRKTCSPGRAVGLTCSEPVRLVGGDSRCAGTLEVKHKSQWRPVSGKYIDWTLKAAGDVCRDLDCGSAVSVRLREEPQERYVWRPRSKQVPSGSALREYLLASFTSAVLKLVCSDSVRLVEGTSQCSGRLVVRQNQSWSSVCETDFDQQDAQVVCRELGCGAPSFLKGVLYGEVEAPTWTKEFYCGGNESSLLDCRSSDSDRKTCSPGRAVGLTCSEPVRLVGGDSRCAGTLEVKHKSQWRPVSGKYIDWTLKAAADVCKDLNCGLAVSIGLRDEYLQRDVWRISSDCLQSGSLRECITSDSAFFLWNLNCSVMSSDSVRLVERTSLCSGRLEVKQNQSWSSVCEADFDQQDAQVVCRELGCGAPSVLQGALYGEVEAPTWTKEFQCGGSESSLLDCRGSDSDRKTCSPGRAVGLTCSEPVRLVGGVSRCAGTLEVKWGEWRPVSDLTQPPGSGWTLKEAAVVCRELGCGSAVSVEKRRESSERHVWWTKSFCVWFRSVKDCITSGLSSSFLALVCSDLLLQPNISASSSIEGVSEAQQQGLQVFKGSTFTISCSIQPQYPGGFFQLTFTSSHSAHNYTRPAVNHSAHFLFPAAEPSHHGNYSCVYHVHVFSHNFSSESHLLYLTVLDPTPFIIRVVVLPLALLFVNTALCLYCKASRGQKRDRQEDMEVDCYNLGVPAAEGSLTEREKPLSRANSTLEN